MPELLLYLLKVNVALLLFYLAYRVVLRKLTFYHLNRLFLVFGMLFAALYPFIDLSELLSRNEELAVMQTYAAIPAWAPALTAVPAQTAAFDYWLIPVTLFWFGTALMAGRLLLQFHTLYKIHRASEPASYQGIDFRKISGIREAFSFWKTIYLNPEQHKKEELKSILRHEQIHVEGWHTLDVLLAELSTVFYWFNPGVWFMKRAIKENLEFIADQHVMNAGVDRKAYQYLLLKAVSTSEPQLANQFNFPSLKRRIAMMNKMPSTKAHLLKFLAVLPVAAVLLIAFNGVARPQANDADAIEISDYVKVGPAIYIKSALIFKTACWTAPHTLTITPITGEADVYQLNKEQDIAEAYKKYSLYLPDNEIYDRVLASIPGSTKEKGFQVVDEYKDFYARNPQVRKLYWTTSNEIIIRLESTEEVYNLEDKASRATAEKKYGKLPSTPPPAQVVTEEEFNAQDKKAQPQDGIFTLTPDDIDYYDDRKNLPVAYTNFLKKNPSVEKVGWRVHSEKGPQATLVYLKSGVTEVYDHSSDKSMATAKSKYGELPGLLPPPPPVMIKNN